jgi:MoaA/NifB/PqqE/SkfB family radical SAM enzyme
MNIQIMVKCIRGDEVKGIRAIVTYRCNMMCSICENRCAPYKKGFMGVKVFEEKIKDASSNGYRDYICISGGEPFLNPAILNRYLKVISTIKTKKIIQTNGFWGNIEPFIDIIIGLKGHGLSEITFEYDYYHGIFIDVEIIKNAISKVLKCQMEVSLTAFFNTSNLSSREDIFTYEAIKKIKKEYKEIRLIFTSSNRQNNFKNIDETVIFHKKQVNFT